MSSRINCNYCRQDGHYIKSRSGKVTCPVLVAKNKRFSNQYKPRFVKSKSEDGWSQVGRQHVPQPKSRGFVKCESTWSALEEEKMPVEECVKEEKMPDLQGSWGNADKSTILKSGNNLGANLGAIKEEHSLADLETEKKEIEEDIAVWQQEFGKNKVRWADKGDLSDLQERLGEVKVAMQRLG